jgi:hypothetical protein
MASKKEQPAETPVELPSHFVFATNSLYLRAGFEHGATLGTAFPHLGAADLRDLLVDVLQTHVIPRLDQSVQTLIVPTVHNPLRAVNVDGVSVRWNAEMGQGPPLTPATIRVTLEDVLACARRRKIAAVPTAA